MKKQASKPAPKLPPANASTLDELDLVNAPRIAELLGLSRLTVYRAIEDGVATTVRVEGPGGKLSYVMRRADVGSLRNSLVTRMRARGMKDADRLARVRIPEN